MAEDNTSNAEDRRLGLHAAIDRRDFLNGLAVGAVGGAAAMTWPRAAEAAPSARAHWGGHLEKAYRLGHALRDGEYDTDVLPARDTGELWDVAIIGAGLSGLAAAATLKRQAAGLEILLLDNQAEAGGAAQVDTFRVKGQILMAPQGSIVFQFPAPAMAPPQAAMDLISDVLPDLKSYAVPHLDRGFGVVRPRDDGQGLAFHQSILNTPMPQAVRAGYFTFLGEMGGFYNDPQWRQALAAADRMTFKDYVTSRGWDAAVYDWMVPELATFFGIPDQVSAAAVIRQYAGGPMVVYSAPEGNALLADALRRDMKRARPAPRFRHDVTVVRVENGRDHVVVTYHKSGRLHRLRARAAIMATGSFVAQYMVRGQSAEKAAAQRRFVYAPIVWINVALHNARALDAADPAFFTMMAGTRASIMICYDKRSADGWRPDRNPDRPTMVGLSVPFHDAGQPARAQAAAGRLQMLELPFADYERWARQDLQAVLGVHGFDAARDIAALSVCRWGHGYVYPDPGFLTDGAREQAAKPFGRIAYAHTDLDGFSHLPGAVGHGWRAAQDVLGML